ncbi:MAG: carboxylating nicotinate-nucleotide diphosphorylase [Deltaproteobacteria bacterium]|nr:carboxylating nicotinate-nucleotide diphosphorylase [Deltaproteobacteria bacterium]MBN2845946.1 carboxylating nicotinate-nucleotide diphosphorylase [Deltaproteobacteria bacterium]
MFRDVGLGKLIAKALEEDVGHGDVTTSAILTGDERGTARAVAKEDMIIAGIDVFKEVFLSVDSDISFHTDCHDGTTVKKGAILAEISGAIRNILTAERVALNFFQRLCGIATLTQKYVEAVKGTGAKIIDTRKTTPGLRDLEKYAVKMGGGFNHRFGLDGGVLIKDNHISAAGGITSAVRGVRNTIPLTMRIEVEVNDLEEVEEALASGVDIIMLDNMKPEEMRKAVLHINGRAIVEASGNVTLGRVRQIAETGVDYISVGALTHSAPAADISLNITMV